MAWTMRTGGTLLAAAALMTAAGPAWAEPALVTAAAARVRAQPSTTAAEVARLPLGATVEASDTAGQGADAWRRVTVQGAPAGGWVAARFLQSYGPGQRDEAWRRLAAQRMAQPDPPFGDLVELVQFLDWAAAEAAGREAKAELSFAALLALSRSVKDIGGAEAELPANGAWIKANETRLVYSEPAGQWMLRASLLWDLEKANRNSPLGDRIAWEAAQIDLPGECEGYLPCYLTYLIEQEGQYLDRQPKGAHAAEALATVEAEFASALKDYDAGDSAFGEWSKDMPAILSDWRKILAKVPGAAKAQAGLAALEKRAKAGAPKGG